jgi:hypothetical protein
MAPPVDCRRCSKIANYLLEVKLCLEEMELDLPGVVVQEVAEVWEGEEQGQAGWEVIDLEPVPVGIVSALIAELEYPIR